MSITRSCEYCSPATSASQIGFVTVSIWTIVGLRNSGAVTRMNSAHGSAAGSAFSSGGAIRIMRSSNPLASRTPSNDSSTTKTIRWPRSDSTLAMATQLLVGPQAPGSGKNAIVLASVMCVCLLSAWVAGVERLGDEADDPRRVRAVRVAVRIVGARVPARARAAPQRRSRQRGEVNLAGSGREATSPRSSTSWPEVRST